MDFTKPTHDEIKAAAQLLLDNIGDCAEGDELPSRLRHIANSKPTEAEELYAEAKRLYLENRKLKKEQPLLPATKPRPGPYRGPYPPEGYAGPWFGIYPPGVSSPPMCIPSGALPDLTPQAHLAGIEVPNAPS